MKKPRRISQRKELDRKDLILLGKACQEYVDYIDSEKFYEDGLENYEHTIFETALELFFKEDIFEWVNERRG